MYLPAAYCKVKLMRGMDNSMRVCLRLSVVVMSMVWGVRLRVVRASCVCVCRVCSTTNVCRVEQCEKSLLLLLLFIFIVFILLYFIFIFYFLYFICYVFFFLWKHLREVSRLERDYHRDYSDVRRLHQTNQEKQSASYTWRSPFVFQPLTT
jgi:hypothetical protein